LLETIDTPVKTLYRRIPLIFTAARFLRHEVLLLAESALTILPIAGFRFFSFAISIPAALIESRFERLP